MLFLQQGSSRSATHTVWSETWYNIEQCYILNASTFLYTASHTHLLHTYTTSHVLHLLIQPFITTYIATYITPH